LKAEGEARVAAKAEMKDKYENAAEFGIPAGASAIASAFGFPADGTLGDGKADQKVPKLVREADEKMKIQGLKAEGEARIAEREAMVEAQKIYELTQYGGKTIADRAAMKANYEQAKKIQDLTAEGAERLASREELKDKQKVYELAIEGAAVLDKRMKAKTEYEQAKKVQELKAEGEARVAAKAEMKDKYENAVGASGGRSRQRSKSSSADPMERLRDVLMASESRAPGL